MSDVYLLVFCTLCCKIVSLVLHLPPEVKQVLPDWMLVIKLVLLIEWQSLQPLHRSHPCTKIENNAYVLHCNRKLLISEYSMIDKG